MADRTETKSPLHRRPRRFRRAPSRARPSPGRRSSMDGTARQAAPAASAAVARSLLPALGFALGPVFEETDFTRWQDVGPPDDFIADTYVPAGHHAWSPSVGEAGKTTVYVRKRNPTRHRRAARTRTTFVAISTRCAHLGCPVRWVEAGAAVRLPLPRRRLRRPRARSRAARRCGRSTASRPGSQNGQVAARPALLASTPS